MFTKDLVRLNSSLIEMKRSKYSLGAVPFNVVL